MRNVMLAPFVVIVLAAGCGSEPAPKAPVKETDTTTVTKTSTAVVTKKDQPAAAASDSTSNIHIDDAIRKACGIPDANAYFAFDSTNIRPEDAKPLDAVATCFATGPLKGKKLALIGHADPRGDGDYNFALGQSRADSIAKYLSTKGLDKGQMSSTSRGALDATGTDEPGWSKDRRVDLMLGS
ncbi:MAG: hypothetical protein NVS3B10_03570 [Polyangiales bacterium]